MSKLSLDEAWVKCLAMWKWIAEVYKEGDIVAVLKAEWMRANDPGREYHCYFCAYHIQNYNRGDEGCSKCPGVLVDSTFDCQRSVYRYDQNPKAFYRKIVELNKLRLEQNAQ